MSARDLSTLVHDEPESSPEFLELLHRVHTKLVVFHLFEWGFTGIGVGAFGVAIVCLPTKFMALHVVDSPLFILSFLVGAVLFSVGVSWFRKPGFFETALLVDRLSGDRGIVHGMACRLSGRATSLVLGKGAERVFEDAFAHLRSVSDRWKAPYSRSFWIAPIAVLGAGLIFVLPPVPGFSAARARAFEDALREARDQTHESAGQVLLRNERSGDQFLAQRLTDLALAMGSEEQPGIQERLEGFAAEIDRRSSILADLTRIVAALPDEKAAKKLRDALDELGPLNLTGEPGSERGTGSGEARGGAGNGAGSRLTPSGQNVLASENNLELKLRDLAQLEPRGEERRLILKVARAVGDHDAEGLLRESEALIGWLAQQPGIENLSLAGARVQALRRSLFPGSSTSQVVASASGVSPTAASEAGTTSRSLTGIVGLDRRAAGFDPRFFGVVDRYFSGQFPPVGRSGLAVNQDSPDSRR